MHKVLFLTNHPSPHMADLFRAVHRHPRMRLHVLFASRQDPGRSWGTHLEGVPCEVLPRLPLGTRLPLNPTAPARVLRYARDGYLPIVCVYTMPASIMSMLLLALARRPWLLMGEAPGQDYRARGAKAALRDSVVRLLAGASSGVLAVGRSGVGAYERLRPGARVAHFQYYEAADRFRSIHRNGPALGRPPAFLVCGALCRRKAPELALQASLKLLQMGLAHRMIFAGSGPLEAGLKDWCRARGCSHVEFRGELDWHRRHEAFRDADVLVHPAVFDGWGMVVPEALAAAMPVVTTESCGAGVDFIRDGENGFLLPAPLSADSLAEKMAVFVRDRALAAPMAALARQSVEEWTPEAGAQRLCEILEGWFPG